MGHEQRAKELEMERQAGLSNEPREISCESAPSEWLEQQARNYLGGLVSQAHGIGELMQPRSSVVGPNGQSAADHDGADDGDGSVADAVDGEAGVAACWEAWERGSADAFSGEGVGRARSATVRSDRYLLYL